jgi:hypothetical protein
MLKYTIILCAGSILLVSAAPTSIGFATSTGEFRVDGSAVRGNATVLEGTLVETAAARSLIHLSDAQITLAPGSRLRVYHDRAVLEKGSGSVRDGLRYMLEAATLRITPEARESVIQLELTAPLLLTVSARGGAADVHSSSSVLAGRVLPGMALAFNPQAGTPATVKVTGIVESRDGLFFLTDETTKVTVQVLGADLSKSTGKMVQITGTSVPDAAPAAGASQVVRVNNIKRIAAGAAAAGSGGAAGSASAGLSPVAIGAIVGGVAVAGTIGGLAGAGAFNSGTSVSRP